MEPQKNRSMVDYHYLAVLAGLTASLCGINAMYKILAVHQLLACSFFFVLTLTLMSYIHQMWGFKTYLQAGAIAWVINALYLGYHWSVLDAYSYGALCPALCVHGLFLRQCSRKYMLPVALFLGCVAATLVDNALLMNGLVVHFGLAKAWLILGRSIGYKLGYSAVVALGLWMVHMLARRGDTKAGVAAVRASVSV